MWYHGIRIKWTCRWQMQGTIFWLSCLLHSHDIVASVFCPDTHASHFESKGQPQLEMLLCISPLQYVLTNGSFPSVYLQTRATYPDVNNSLLTEWPNVKVLTLHCVPPGSYVGRVVGQHISEFSLWTHRHHLWNMVADFFVALRAHIGTEWWTHHPDDSAHLVTHTKLGIFFLFLNSTPFPAPPFHT